MTWNPTRKIQIVAGTPPGGGLDRSARALLRAIQAHNLIAVPAEVVNVGGDGGRKAWAHIDGFAGDPHVIGISAPNLLADYLTGATSIDPDRYTPLAILYTEFIAFIVRSDSKLDDGADLVRLFAQQADRVTVALSTSLGNSNHVAVAMVIRHAGGDPRAPNIRVFDTALDAVADVVAGNADVGAVTAASAVSELAAGRLRALGVSSSARLSGVYASTSTWSEQAVDCTIGSWRGVSGPAQLVPEHVLFWQGALSAATGTAEWRADLDRHFWTDMYMDGAQLRDFLERERKDMRSILSGLGLMKSASQSN
jgi:putative tricarboxylic transport membrane protein